MRQGFKVGASAAAKIRRGAGANAGFVVGGTFKFVCRDRNGMVKWVEEAHNEVTNVGINDILDVMFGAQAKRSWYVGLTDSTPTESVSDTMSSHAGWSEIYTQYSQTNRPAYTVAAAASQSVTNAASVATFSFTASATIGGAFITSDNTKNGTTGILFSVVAFTGGDRTVGNGDSVEVTYVLNGADDGV